MNHCFVSLPPYSLTNYTFKVLYSCDYDQHHPKILDKIPKPISSRIGVFIAPVLALMADCFGNICIGTFKKFSSKKEPTRGLHNKIVALHFQAARDGFKNFLQGIYLLIPRIYEPKLGVNGITSKFSFYHIRSTTNEMQNLLQETNKKVSTLQAAYRNRSKTATLPADKKKLMLSKCINNLVFWKDREGLKTLAYSLFRNVDKGFREITSSNLHLLMQLFEDPEAYLSDIADVILKTYEEYKSYKKEIEQSKEHKIFEDYNNSRLNNKSRCQWNAGRVDPDEMIKISHGGGLNHINEFLSGRSKGYALEGPGRGIQVSPVDLGRDGFYSLRAPKFFDEPAMLHAEIQAKYLDAAPNAYEAGLRYEYVQHLRNVKVERTLVTKRAIYGNLPSYIDWKRIQTIYSKAQFERFKLMRDKLSREHYGYSFL